MLDARAGAVGPTHTAAAATSTAATVVRAARWWLVFAMRGIRSSFSSGWCAIGATTSVQSVASSTEVISDVYQLTSVHHNPDYTALLSRPELQESVWRTDCEHISAIDGVSIQPICSLPRIDSGHCCRWLHSRTEHSTG